MIDNRRGVGIRAEEWQLERHIVRLRVHNVEPVRELRYPPPNIRTLRIVTPGLFYRIINARVGGEICADARNPLPVSG